MKKRLEKGALALRAERSGMPCACEIVVREARAGDAPARGDLVRQGFASHTWDAFILFFFQELTLQVCVLGSAVLFIFAGVSAAGCLLLLPAAAAALMLAVHVSHLALADKHVQSMRSELVGFVAELRGPLPLLADAARASPAVVLETDLRMDASQAIYSTKIVGTVSVLEFWGPRQSGWMHALAVDPSWRGRGAGSGLVRAAGSWAAARGLRSLECAASELQPHVRALTHKAGWEVRGWYHRRLAGAALTLLVAQLGLDLPHA